MSRLQAFIRTREGIVTVVFGSVFAVLLGGALAGGAGPLRALVVGPLGGFGGALVLTGIAKIWWEARTAPTVPPFARRPSSTSTSAQLRRDNDAAFFRDRGGFLFRERVWFVGTGCPPLESTPEQFGLFSTAHARAIEPVLVAHHGERQWWWWQDAYYWDSGGYAAADVKALLFRRALRQQRELDHAHAVMAAGASTATRPRPSIPRDVKSVVFERDGGRCVECCSNFEIQYDHVIPFALGGSSTAENLQLLCAPCNQAKGATL